MTSYSTTETITEDDLITVSRVFPPASRPQLLILRNLLNDRKAAYRTYGLAPTKSDTNSPLN